MNQTNLPPLEITVTLENMTMETIKNMIFMYQFLGVELFLDLHIPIRNIKINQE